MLVVRKDLAVAHPQAIRDLWDAIRRARPAQSSGIANGYDMAAIGVAANRGAIDMILRYCAQQKLLPRPLGVDEVFADAVALLGEAVAT